MTGKELQDILLSTNLYTTENCIMVEKDELGGLHNVYTGFYLKNYKYNEKISIKVYRTKSTGELYVDFIIFGNNIFYSDKLKETTLPIVVEQLDKFMSRKESWRQARRDLILTHLISN